MYRKYDIPLGHSKGFLLVDETCGKLDFELLQFAGEPPVYLKCFFEKPHQFSQFVGGLQCDKRLLHSVLEAEDTCSPVRKLPSELGAITLEVRDDDESLMDEALQEHLASFRNVQSALDNWLSTMAYLGRQLKTKGPTVSEAIPSNLTWEQQTYLLTGNSVVYEIVYQPRENYPYRVSLGRSFETGFDYPLELIEANADDAIDGNPYGPAEMHFMTLQLVDSDSVMDVMKALQDNAVEFEECDAEIWTRIGRVVVDGISVARVTLNERMVKAEKAWLCGNRSVDDYYSEHIKFVLASVNDGITHHILNYVHCSLQACERMAEAVANLQ